MNNPLVNICTVVFLLILNFHNAGPAFAQSNKAGPTVSEIALNFPQGESRLQSLAAAAKKEGGLTVYASMAVDDMTPLLDAFTQKYGIKVKIWKSSSENVLQRIITEARGGRYDVDIVENNAPEMEALHREKLLQQVKSPYHRELMAQAIPAHKEWIGTTIDIYVQAYNTEKIKKEDLPKTYYDLLNPKWKGQLGIEVDNFPWFATLMQALGQEEGEKLFKGIVDTNGISLRKGHSLLTNLVGSGEVPLGLTIYNYKPIQLKEKGMPIEGFIIPPAIAAFRGVGLLKKAPHPHAALLFTTSCKTKGSSF